MLGVSAKGSSGGGGRGGSNAKKSLVSVRLTPSGNSGRKPLARVQGGTVGVQLMAATREQVWEQGAKQRDSVSNPTTQRITPDQAKALASLPPKLPENVRAAVLLMNGRRPLKQCAAAKKAGCGLSTLSGWLNGKVTRAKSGRPRVVDGEMLSAVAAAVRNFQGAEDGLSMDDVTGHFATLGQWKDGVPSASSTRRLRDDLKVLSREQEVVLGGGLGTITYGASKNTTRARQAACSKQTLLMFYGTWIEQMGGAESTQAATMDEVSGDPPSVLWCVQSCRLLASGRCIGTQRT
jgi:hypothetical protein